MQNLPTDQHDRPHVLVLGDLMLDRYTYGVVDRISPEAPVLVVNTTSREVRLGGAANVAANCRALGAKVTAIGIVGNDPEGVTLKHLLQECGAEAKLFVDSSRCTTVKDRILGQSPHRTPQQILRIDTETTASAKEFEGELLAAIAEILPSVQVLLISDYRKGVCTTGLLRNLVAIANQQQLPILVDPGVNADWSDYQGASLIKPNRGEAATAAGLGIHTENDAATAASNLSTRFDIPSVVMTLDQDGMLLHRSGRPVSCYRGTRREVCDVTGAGDTVFAVLGVALAQGLDLEAAALHALTAAGLQVERQGATSITWEEIARDQAASARNSKIVSWEWIERRCADFRMQGRRIVVTNGCFDLLHAGHVACLQEARSHGDLLIVALNSDASVKRLKGSTRPVNGVANRAAVLAALDCTDFVVVFEEDTPEELIRRIKPDVLVKGGEYSPDQIPGRDFVVSYGGRVIVTAQLAGISTTAILARGRQEVG